MSIRVIPCLYKNSNSLVEQLGDLKISYSATQNSWITNILSQMEDLILFRVGDIESLRLTMASIKNPTFEERCFLEKVNSILL